MRNYAPQLLKAYALANGVFTPDIVEQEIELAKDYDYERSNQAIILYSDELKKVLRLPYFMRLKPEYVKVVKSKIWGGIYPQISGCNDFVFLTLDASTSNYCSQQDAHIKVQKHWNSLLTRIRRKYPWVKVIKSVEWQSNGLGYHIHALLVGIRFLPKDWVKKTWDKLETSGWSIQIERGFDNPKRALAYLMKYVTKSLRSGDELPLSLVVNWALGLRTLAVSHSFSSLKTNSNKKSVFDWVFVGIMPWFEAVSRSDIEVLEYFGYG